MKALIDTEILLRHDTKKKPHQDTEKLYSWLDRAGYEKWIVQSSADLLASQVLKRTETYSVFSRSVLSAEVEAVGHRLDESGQRRDIVETLDQLSFHQGTCQRIPILHLQVV